MQKHFLSILLILCLLVSCNGDKKSVESQLEQARSLYELAQYGLAKQMLDELKIQHPKQLEVQKEALHLMREIDLQEQKRNLLYCDSLLKVRQLEADSMKRYFDYTMEPQYDTMGRYIDKTHNPVSGSSSRYLKINVNALGEIALSSVYVGSPAINHNQIRVSLSSGVFAETEVIPFDGGMNYSFRDGLGTTYETVTYQKGRDNGVIQFVYNYSNEKLTVEFLGDRKISFALSDKEKSAIVRTAHFSMILTDIERLKEEITKAEKRIEYLEEKLRNSHSN
jgi:hypothetical protein